MNRGRRLEGASLSVWLFAIGISILICACSSNVQADEAETPRKNRIDKAQEPAIKAPDTPGREVAPKSQFEPAPINKARHILYPWLTPTTRIRSTPLVTRFKTPAGFRRIALSHGSFGAWLRNLPIRTDRTHVLSYADDPLSRPSAAVVLMDVGQRDLQQCADSAIRLHAEFLWHAGRASRAGYHFTSGDLSKWTDWQRGERFKLRGRGVDRVSGKARSNTHKSYRRWLDLIFTYAGTLSLHRDTDAVGTRPYAPGDTFLLGGSPGHAVVLLDIAQNGDGDTLGLIGQGFMPAEDFHVLKDSGSHVVDGVWFKLPKEMDAPIPTPSWSQPFSRKNARRFKLPKGLKAR